MNPLLTNGANLFKVKTILSLVGAFIIAYAVVRQVAVPEWIVALVSSIFTYYFTKTKDNA